MAIRHRIFVPFEVLWKEPAPEDKSPGVWFVGLMAGQRRLLRAAGSEHNERVQALRDEDPEVDKILWERHQRLVDRLKKEMEGQQKEATSAKEGAVGAKREKAGNTEDHQEELAESQERVEELQHEPRLNAVLALQSKLRNLNQQWITSQLAICIRRLEGNMALVDPDEFGERELKDLWPRLDLSDPGVALQRRRETLEILDEQEREQLSKALEAFLRGGGAGLTKSQKGN